MNQDTKDAIEMGISAAGLILQGISIWLAYRIPKSKKPCKRRRRRKQKR